MLPSAAAGRPRPRGRGAGGGIRQAAACEVRRPRDVLLVDRVDRGGADRHQHPARLGRTPFRASASSVGDRAAHETPRRAGRRCRRAPASRGNAGDGAWCPCQPPGTRFVRVLSDAVSRETIRKRTLRASASTRRSSTSLISVPVVAEDGPAGACCTVAAIAREMLLRQAAQGDEGTGQRPCRSLPVGLGSSRTSVCLLLLMDTLSATGASAKRGPDPRTWISLMLRVGCDGVTPARLLRAPVALLPASRLRGATGRQLTPSGELLVRLTALRGRRGRPVSFCRRRRMPPTRRRNSSHADRARRRPENRWRAESASRSTPRTRKVAIISGTRPRISGRAPLVQPDPREVERGEGGLDRGGRRRRDLADLLEGGLGGHQIAEFGGDLPPPGGGA